jgi:class 3 adenylate cyclase/tetratricopeptide (TPR) repeat protein
MSGEPRGATGSLFTCPACGTPAVTGARFCFNCGTPLERFDADRGPDAGTERRVVTVLFGDLSDFTAWAEELDPERVGAVTSRLLTALSETVTDVGGHVDKLTGDGIMAVFGAPTAHEDDPQRAVLAAYAMQRAVRRLVADESGGGRALGLRVGLNTGEVLAGVQAGMSYTVVGDTVNTAARLSDAAGVGAVWAGRDTALATMSLASWRALPPLRLKGKREPVAAYELVRLRSQSADRAGLGEEAPFIGRDVERGLLIGRVLDVIERARPSTVVITGEAGIGKTRLAGELSRFTAEIDGSRVLWGRCAPYGEGRNLRPLAEWVRTACGIATADLGNLAEMAARVRRTVARLEPVAGQIAVEPLLALVGLTEWDTPPPRESAAPGASSPESTVEAVTTLLSNLAGTGPLLLVVDDLQWATDELLDALVAVAANLSGPILLVVGGRSDLLTPGARPGWWQSLPDSELLPLLPLERAAADRLLRAYLGGSELEPAVRNALLDRAQGNPFFLAELLHLLVDRGLLRREADGWVLIGELPQDVLPAGVQAVLTARFDDLDPNAKAVLRDAAVIGARFPDPALVALASTQGYDNPAADVAAALETLRERDIVRLLLPGSHVFTHSLARDVAYAAVPKAERAHRHAAVVRWAVGDLRGPPVEVDSFVATQAERAVALAHEMALAPDDPAWGARAAGFAALLRLGDAVLAGDEPAAAADVFGRALALAESVLDVTDIGRARVGRAAGLLALHDYAGAEKELAEALSVTDPRLQGRTNVVLGELRRRQGDESAAADALNTALAAARAVGDDVTAGDALRQLGLLDYLAGRMTSAEQRLSEALVLAERVGDRRGAGWALQHLAWSATSRGAHHVAEDALRRAAEVFTELDDMRGLSWCAGSEAFLRLLEGRLADARDLASGLLPLGEQIGDRWGVAACLTIDAIAAAELGDPQTAAEEADRARQLFGEISDGWGRALATVALGIAARCAGDTRRAVERLEEAVAIAQQGSYDALVSLSYVVLGYAHLDAGAAEAAESVAKKAAETAAQLDLERYASAGFEVLLAQALRARGQTADALAILERADAAGAAADGSTPSLLFPRRQVVAHHAGALLESGRIDEADAVIARAMEIPAEDIRSHVVALRVLGAIRAAQGRREDAADALSAAHDLASDAGYGAEVLLTDRARDRLATSSS